MPKAGVGYYVCPACGTRKRIIDTHENYEMPKYIACGWRGCRAMCIIEDNEHLTFKATLSARDDYFVHGQELDVIGKQLHLPNNTEITIVDYEIVDGDVILECVTNNNNLIEVKMGVTES